MTWSDGAAPRTGTGARFGFGAALLLGIVGTFVSPVSAQQRDLSWAPEGWSPAGSPAGGTPTWYEARAAELVAQMSDEEKIQQLGHGTPGIGRLGIAGYGYCSEALHGIRSFAYGDPIPGFTVFPAPIALGATWDPALVHAIAAGIADEARGSNASAGTPLVFFSPVINMLRDPRWGRYDESYGEDPHHMVQMGNAYIAGLQGDDPDYLKAVATAKHYVANNQENTRFWTSADMDERMLREYYLPQFRAAVTEAHVFGIMASYNATNGVPNAANTLLLWTRLREEWGFDGFVVGDCNAVDWMSTFHQYASSSVEAAALAILAGTDLDCGWNYQGNLGEALSNGWILSEDLDRALTRVLSARVRLGEFEDPSQVPYSSIDASAIRSTENLQLALTAARESITLLKNDGILPLSGTLQSIALIGPHADSAYMGGYSGIAENAITARQGLQQMFAAGGPTINYQQGCTITGGRDDGMFSAATQAASSSDVAIVVLGTDDTVMREEMDRSDWNLPGVQLDLLQAVVAANPRTVLVLATGAPLGVDWAQANVPAILSSWHNGEFQGQALAEVLFGEVSPAGRTSTTWYSSTASLPPMEDYDIRENGRTYMYYADEPLYPFGHGLSYTEFSYAGLSVDPPVISQSGQTVVSFELTNSGSVAGDEVAQVYVHDNASSVPRPIKQLRAFQRTNLAPGQTTTLELPINAQDLALWDPATQTWVVSNGTYEVIVGASSTDTRLTDSFVIGDVAGTGGAGGTGGAQAGGAGTGGSSGSPSGGAGATQTGGAGTSGTGGSPSGGTGGAETGSGSSPNAGTGGLASGGTGDAGNGGSVGVGGLANGGPIVDSAGSQENSSESSCSCATPGRASPRPGGLVFLFGFIAACIARLRGRTNVTRTHLLQRETPHAGRATMTNPHPS